MLLKRDETPFRGVASPVDNAGCYQPVSFWQETVAVSPGAPLDEDLTCDVAIVGGGFTGLSIAYHLKKHAPTLDVVLMEQGVVGHGASGRNGGFVMPLIGWDLLYTAEKLGEEAAGAVFRLMYEAVDHLRQTVADHGIDCDLEHTGYLLINTCRAREARARRELAVAHRLGFDHAWLDKTALNEHIRSDRYLSGVFDPHPCIINPAKLARGMKTVVEDMGVKVFEQTPLQELREGTPVQIQTPGGTVRATQAALAVNGYAASIGLMKNSLLPVHTYIVLTEPLTGTQLAEIGWHKKRASLETARNFIHYFRLTADNRILFGGEDAELYLRGQYQDFNETLFKALRVAFGKQFPSLSGIRFTHAWGGVLGVTLDMFPTFGQTGQSGGIFHAGGYAGHGVALSNYAGAILAPQMLRAAGLKAEAPEVPFFYGRQPTWLPPDPLRYAGMRVYRHALRLQDRIQGA